MGGPGKIGNLVELGKTEQEFDYLFHGNRYNRGHDTWPAKTNAGPCKRNKQFKDNYEEELVRNCASSAASSGSCTTTSIGSEMRRVMSDDSPQYPIFRTKPDYVVTLFSTFFEFFPDEKALRVSLWRHRGDGKEPVDTTQPMIKRRYEYRVNRWLKNRFIDG